MDEIKQKCRICGDPAQEVFVYIDGTREYYCGDSNHWPLVMPKGLASMVGL